MRESGVWGEQDMDQIGQSAGAGEGASGRLTRPHLNLLPPAIGIQASHTALPSSPEPKGPGWPLALVGGLQVVP